MAGMPAPEVLVWPVSELLDNWRTGSHCLNMEEGEQFPLPEIISSLRMSQEILEAKEEVRVMRLDCRFFVFCSCEEDEPLPCSLK